MRNEMTLNERVEELELRMGDLVFQYEVCVAEEYFWESIEEQVADTGMDVRHRDTF